MPTTARLCRAACNRRPVADFRPTSAAAGKLKKRDGAPEIVLEPTPDILAAPDVALRDEDHNMPLSDWIENENFNPGYLMRGLDQLPRRGDKPEWRHNQDYWREKDEIPAIDLDSAEFCYG